MSKRNKLIYWIATGWLSLGMVSSGIIQVMHQRDEMLQMQRLGYAPYFMTILGVWKLLGVIVILAPRLPLLKEWAYAGFFFAMTGAILSHIATGTVADLFGSSLLLVLTVLSWASRPASRKLSLVLQPAQL